MTVATSTFSVSFIARAIKSNQDQSGIYARITINGKRSEFVIIKSIPSESWIASKEKLNHTCNDFRNCNSFIDNTRSKLFNIYREFVLNNKTVSTQLIKNHFFGKIDRGHTLKTLITYHKKTQETILSSETLTHYRTAEKYLTLFLKNERFINDIYLHVIDYKFLTDFDLFLRTYTPEDYHKSLSNNAVMKHHTKLKKMLNMAVKLDWITKNPYNNFQIKYINTERECLSKQELLSIENKVFSVPRLDYIKDLFVFSCYIGLSYIDVNNLSPEHIVLAINGERWIHTKRQKTNIPLHIPLLPKALQLIEKYQNNPRSVHHDRIFPPISNQKVNSYLKEIANLCGIRKNLTFHLARHTFATIVTLSNGVPIETVSKILGHTKLATTQIYAHVLKNKISEDMSELRKKLENNTSMNVTKDISCGG
ncbi:MAG: site-specific integrase [Marinilabiliaceae bacterium]|nr:site-specific integrase [Marinilabiliaceae bacterium]